MDQFGNCQNHFLIGCNKLIFNSFVLVHQLQYDVDLAELHSSPKHEILGDLPQANLRGSTNANIFWSDLSGSLPTLNTPDITLGDCVKTQNPETTHSPPHKV